MLRNKIATILLAATLASTSALAFANPDDFDRGQQDYGYQNDRDAPPNHGPEGHPDSYDRNRAPQPHEDWKRGDRVPGEFRSKEHYVNDWRDRDLPQPPRGHRWLEVNGDYILVAVATGIITSILMGGR
ncbi:hypothetical protein F4V57_12560 [Acinetobacter qingfengensis]|uniref:RcnB family protein n=1 Tax=Acinetobacter qingfengensis TaxID=1262585 RepID=A0A1E7QYN5_9GAMM|nr:RcnB family protein [Acinetobacter qingfengensis]KAA8731415.1 hypothetical protein F4V57_12560 [Acinetobacter qingfengensis]OEY92182.1 hypothetical protein BJI46_05350 [Acinetobacter qingfengensis]